MEGFAVLSVILLVCLGILMFIGYIYTFYVVATMESTSGNPYLAVETNLQPMN